MLFPCDSRAEGVAKQVFFRDQPCLYFVTPELRESLDSWIVLVEEAIQGGVDLVQLRLKKSSLATIAAVGYALQKRLKKLQIPLIINDHIQIARLLHADGVHLGQSDGKVEEARRWLGPTAIIGLSIGTKQEAEAAEKEPLSYIAASPVFHSKSKPGCERSWGLDGLQELVRLTHHPVVAIGGIDEGNIREVVDSGVAAIAIISAIAEADVPKKAVEQLVNKMKREEGSPSVEWIGTRPFNSNRAFRQLLLVRQAKQFAESVES